MPELDGPGLYRALAQHASQLCQRFIFLTGDTLSPETLAFFDAERRAPADQTLHRGGGSAYHCAGAAGRVSVCRGAVQ